METKPFWASKTLWVNIIGLIASVLTAFGVTDLDAELQASIVGIAMTVINIVLRFATTTAVSTSANE